MYQLALSTEPPGRATRRLATVGLGAVMTASLFLIMLALIDSENAPPTEIIPTPSLTWVQVPDEPPPPVTEPPERPQDIEFPPPIKTPIATDDGPTIGPIVTLPPPPPPDPDLAAPASVSMTPLVAAAPTYPQRAAAQGVEGYVLLRFTVSDVGLVEDAVVVQSEPRGYFERAALNAVGRYRYNPRVVDGSPVPVSGIHQVIRFNLQH